MRAFVVGLVAVILGGYLGTALAAKWSVSTPAIEIAAGLILLLVAVRLVMAPYESPQSLPPLPASPMAATLRLTFPLWAVLGVLQFALAIQIIIRGLRDLEVLPA